MYRPDTSVSRTNMSHPFHGEPQRERGEKAGTDIYVDNNKVTGVP